MLLFYFMLILVIISPFLKYINNDHDSLQTIVEIEGEKDYVRCFLKKIILIIIIFCIVIFLK